MVGTSNKTHCELIIAYKICSTPLFILQNLGIKYTRLNNTCLKICIGERPSERKNSVAQLRENPSIF